MIAAHIDWTTWPDAQLAVAAEFCSIPEDQQAIATEIAARIDREYQARQERYDTARATAVRIAKNITAYGPICGFSGIDPNTRRIAYRAALTAALDVLEVPCPDCGDISTHRVGCQRRDSE